MTLKEIEDGLMTKCNTLGLEGVISTSVAKLLAYAIYLDSADVNNKILNSLFASATNINNTLAHACNLLYSTYRGETSRVLYKNIMAGKTTVYKYLDPAFQFNGYYYYFDKDYVDITATAMYDIGYISSDKPILECTATAAKDSYQFIDFTASNVSENLVLYGVDSSGNEVRLTHTDSPYEFLKNEKDSTGEFIYQYLLITNINYGVRLLKRYEEQDAETKEVTWRYPKYKIKYIPYSEFIPNLISLRSLGDFNYIEDLGVSYESNLTKLEVTRFKAREENPEVIYMQASKYFMSRNQIGSITDIEYIIQSYGDSNTEVIYNIVTRTDSEESKKVVGYDIYIDLSSELRDKIKSEIESRNPPFPTEVYSMEALDIGLTYDSESDYYTVVDLNEYFGPIWRAERSLDINEMEAQILRYDSGMTRCILSGEIPELANNQYYNITLVKS